MKKFIIFCLLLFAICVQAEDGVPHYKYGDLLIQKALQNDEAVYGLSFEDTQVLSCQYQYQYNEHLQLLVMYNLEEIYVFGIFDAEPIFHYRFSTSQKKYPKVIYAPEEILKRACYRLIIKSDMEKIAGGIFCKEGGRTCRLEFNPVN